MKEITQQDAEELLSIVKHEYEIECKYCAAEINCEQAPCLERLRKKAIIARLESPAGCGKRLNIYHNEVAFCGKDYDGVKYYCKTCEKNKEY